MLTEVKAYTLRQSAPQLLLDEDGRAETDLIQIYGIEGLTPVPATVSTVPYGSIDGEAHVGSNIFKRNLVLALHPNPDWNTWSFEALRNLLYEYFMPKQEVQIGLYRDDKPDVYIKGVVESFDTNPFSTDTSFIVSIICPDPYFKTIVPEILSGDDGDVVTIDYNGNVEAGIKVKVTHVSLPGLISGIPYIKIQLGSAFKVFTLVGPLKTFEMSSIPTNKYVQYIDLDSSLKYSLLSKVEQGSIWPTLKPGENSFSVITSHGDQIWELTYNERYGGL